MKTTIGEVLSYFDAQVPNQYSDEEKIRWLNEIEAQIYNDIIKTHRDADKIAFNGYSRYRYKYTNDSAARIQRVI